MAKKRKMTTEKPPVEVTTRGSDRIDEQLSEVNSITKTPSNQGKSLFDDDAKGRHFWFVVYPSEEYIKTHYPDCGYDGADGWGQAPADWVEQLQNTGLAFQVSELHCMDVNPDGTLKKPHWHVIVSWGNTTTYRSARGLSEILKSPLPMLLHDVTGAYRYHRHLDHPHKHQYATFGTYHNGWTAPISGNEVERIKQEIKDIILLEDVQEYAELLIVCEEKGQEYVRVATNNTIFCERVCASYRHNPVRVLMRYFNSTTDEKKRAIIDARIDELTGGKAK